MPFQNHKNKNIDIKFMQWIIRETFYYDRGT